MFRNEYVIKNDLDVFEELWRWLERCLERACELKERLAAQGKVGGVWEKGKWKGVAEAHRSRPKTG